MTRIQIIISNNENVFDMSTLGDAAHVNFWQIPRHRTLSYSQSTPCFVTTAL